MAGLVGGSARHKPATQSRRVVPFNNVYNLHNSITTAALTDGDDDGLGSRIVRLERVWKLKKLLGLLI